MEVELVASCHLDQQTAEIATDLLIAACEASALLAHVANGLAWRSTRLRNGVA